MLLAAACAAATPALAQDSAPQVTLNAAELFGFADAARERGDYETAEAAYRALTQDPELELRTEARFRLARLYAGPMDRQREVASRACYPHMPAEPVRPRREHPARAS